MEPASSSSEEHGEMAPAASSEQQQGTQEGDQVASSSSSRAEENEEDAEMMPAALSQEQQEEEGAEISPAASEQQEEETGERVQMIRTPASKMKEEVKTKIEEILRLVEPLPERIAVLLEAAGPRLVRDHPKRRALEFMRMELTEIIESLKLMLPPLLDIGVGVGEGLKMDWLNGLNLFARDAKILVKQVADSRLNTLLRRPARFFRRSNKVLLFLMSESFRAAEYANRYRHVLLAGANAGPAALPPPPCPAHALFGIDRPTKKLLRWLIPQDQEGTENRLRFMAIVGPAGVGKTTLAMEVHRRRLQYQASTGHGSFQCSVVAQVSTGTSRMEQLLRDILSGISDRTAPAVPSDQPPSKTMELLVGRVKEHLQDKRYFILIDSLWHTGDWEEIKGSFPNNNLGSRVLITTRVTSIAWSCCSDSDDDVLVHEMKPLNRVDSERLLIEKAFGSPDACPPDNLKPFCDKILMTCQGIPLFINGMADWLIEQLQQQQHLPPPQEEEEDQRFVIYSEEQVHPLPERFGQLSSAFDDLSSELTTVFLCMSMFPYRCSTEKDSLILKWLSECHTSWQSNLDIDKHKELGEEYFSQLTDRNVITSVTWNCKPSLDETQWHVNQCMLQLLASKSARTGFALSSGSAMLLDPRRLALHHPDPLLPSLVQTLDLSRTRWLTITGAVSGIPLEKFVNLVALDLEGWKKFNDDGLEHICRANLLVLEYLSIRNTHVTKLPHEIKELQNLMILDVSCTQISVLPFGVSRLKRLYHLDLRGTGIGQLGKEIVGLQSTLHTLLVGDEGIINSVEGAARVPHEIHHLRWLRTLATIDLTGHPASFIEALGDLTHLRVLAITWSFHQCTDKSYHYALLSSLKKMQDSLVSLTIHCGLGCSMGFLSALHGHWSNRLYVLQTFKVTAGRFACVPKWVDQLQVEDLSFVQITICRLEKCDLKRLGELKKLRCLVLGLDFIPREAIVIEKVWFRELQRFSIDCPIPWLTFKTESMRKLRYLQMRLCPFPASKTNVPSGTGNLSSLMEVALCCNPQEIISPNISMIVGAMRKAVAEHPNQIDFFINGVQDYDVQAVDEVTENATNTLSGTSARARDDAQAAHQVATAAAQSEITEDES